jgi:hypothetical protein
VYDTALLGFSVSKVTDKKSSWILIYYNKDARIYTQNDGMIKPKWNKGATLKVGEFNNLRNILIYKWL